ncbi:hypothetical protein SAMD00019534_053780, partial [Acytostelium subglobosum LB1]|uniref:hypothetical protein n=1 Tax=Acytostelium subglobosum LB1 TaxID=1410327 RepID=UPI0006448BB4
MDNILKINWENLTSAKELKDAICEWCDHSEYEITRTDILRLLSKHNIHIGELHQDEQCGLFEIVVDIPAKDFYGIHSKWHLTFFFSECGHLLSIDTDRQFESINPKFYDQFIKRDYDDSVVQM